MENRFDIDIKIKFQQVIDLIYQKKIKESQLQLDEAIGIINDIIDLSTSDKELQKMSSYQVMINHLQLKIDILKTSLS